MPTALPDSPPRRPRRRSGPLLVTLCAVLACAPGDREPAAPGPPFVEVAAEAGLDFVHQNGMSGELFFSEMTGGGGALFDFDADGDLDLFAVQGHPLGKGRPGGAARSGGRLYRNDLDRDATLGEVPSFRDATEASGIHAHGYGMGAVTGDIDNDGHVDLYLVSFGSNQLWRNRGDGTFEDVTERAGVGDPGWSVGGAFLDYDRDGWLDLYVVNYVLYTVEAHKPCLSQAGAVDYCGPQSYPPAPDRLYRNRGDGTFEDVTIGSRIGDEVGSGLGVVSADFDGDGWIDLYVANDLMRNFLWINQRDGTFRNDALLAGCAVDRIGRAQASMGVDAGDLDGDGDLDLFMTHLVNDSNTLYLNDGHGMFRDGTVDSRLGPPSIPFTGFGIGVLDYDQDGWLDLLVANGAVTLIESQRQAGEPYPLRQRSQLFRNLGGGVFAETSDQVPSLARAEVSRGIAQGDVDNDGDRDAVVFNNNGPLRLLINRVGQAAHWVGARLIGATARRDMLGAVVDVIGTDGPVLRRRVGTDGSYASASDPRVSFGLGTRDRPVRLRVRWPSGASEDFTDLAVDRYHVLHESHGTRTADP